MTTAPASFQTGGAGTRAVPAPALCAGHVGETVATCGWFVDLGAGLGAGDLPPRRIQIMPGGGTVAPNDGREPWRLSDAAQVVRASLAAAPGGLLAIDYDHAADLAAPKGEPAPASGWITGLESDAAGAIWATVDWTPRGASALAAREYRFFSPSFLHTADRTVTRIIGGALTNRPALSNLPALASTFVSALVSAPLVSAQGDPMDPILAAVLEALGLPKTADQTATLAAITALKGGTAVATPALCAAAGLAAGASADQLASAVTGLRETAGQVRAIASAAGLPETATAAELVTAVRTLKANASAATVLESQVATLSSRLQSLESAGLAAEVDAALAAGKFTPAMRDDLLAIASADKPRFDRLVAAAVPVLKPGETGGNPPPADGGLTAEQKAVCAALNLSEDAFKATLGLAKKEG